MIRAIEGAGPASLLQSIHRIDCLCCAKPAPTPLTVSGFARSTSPPHAWGRGKASQGKQRKDDYLELVSVAANAKSQSNDPISLHKVFDVRRMDCEAGFRGGDRFSWLANLDPGEEIGQPPGKAYPCLTMTWRTEV